jgi:hypothetical protein
MKSYTLPGLWYIIPYHKLPCRNYAKTQTGRFHHWVSWHSQSLNDAYTGQRTNQSYNQRFMQEVDKEISETRLSLNTRARNVAESYLATVSIRFEKSSKVSLLSWQTISSVLLSVTCSKGSWGLSQDDKEGWEISRGLIDDNLGTRIIVIWFKRMKCK